MFRHETVAYDQIEQTIYSRRKIYSRPRDLTLKNLLIIFPYQPQKAILSGTHFPRILVAQKVTTNSQLLGLWASSTSITSKMVKTRRGKDTNDQGSELTKLKRTGIFFGPLDVLPDVIIEACQKRVDNYKNELLGADVAEEDNVFRPVTSAMDLLRCEVRHSVARLGPVTEKHVLPVFEGAEDLLSQDPRASPTEAVQELLVRTRRMISFFKDLIEDTKEHYQPK